MMSGPVNQYQICRSNIAGKDTLCNLLNLPDVP